MSVTRRPLPSFMSALTFILSPGWVLSSFFYGYILTQIPGGFLATRFSGKHVFGLGVVLTSVLTLLTPVAATTNIWLLVALRVLEGICEVRWWVCMSRLVYVRMYVQHSVCVCGCVGGGGGCVNVGYGLC